MKTHNIHPFLRSITAPVIALAFMAAVAPPAQATRLGGNGTAILSDAISSGASIAQGVVIEVTEPDSGTTIDALSGNYQITASVGDIAEAVTDTEGAVVGIPAEPTKISGFCGMLYEIKSLQLAATPSTLATGNSSILTLAATLHDNSTIAVDPRYAFWQSTGPVVLSANETTRIATAQGVPLQTSSSVLATFLRPNPASTAIIVQSDGTGIGIDPSWLASHNLSALVPLSDSDKDGIPQLLEAVFNFNPHAADAQASHTTGFHRESGMDYLMLRFRHNTRNEGVAVSVERATNLSSGDFSTAGVVEVLPVTPIDANTEWRTFRSTTPIGPGKEFLRLKAVYTPPAN